MEGITILKRVLIAIIAFLTILSIWIMIVIPYIWQLPKYVETDLGIQPESKSIVINRREGFAVTYYNEDGMLGVPLSSITPDMKKILILGSSHTEAWHVQSKESFAGLLQERLNQGATKFAVVNSGKGGVGIPQYIALGSNYDRKINPDIVIIEANADNFIYQATNSNNRYYVHENAGGELLIIDNPRKSSLGRRLLDFVEDVAGSTTRVRIQSFIALVQERWFGYFPNGFVSKFAERLKIENRTSNLKKITVENPERINSLIEWQIGKIRGTFPSKLIILLYLPPRDLIITPNKLLLPNAYITYRDYISRNCEENGIYFVDIFPGCEQEYQLSHSLPVGFSNSIYGAGHLNRVGHRIAAKEIADLILRIKL